MELNRQQSYSNASRNLMLNILEMFPDASQSYVRHLCIGKTDNFWDAENVLQYFINGDYPKQELTISEEETIAENLNTLEILFPDADIHFLHYHAVLYLNDTEKLQEFINEHLENGDYPVVRKNASTRKNGQFYICNCCYDEEIKSRDLGTCENGCVFCKSCIQRSVEISFGQGKLDFPCLLGCTANFNLQTLENVLARKFYYKIVQKKQIQEVKDAQIENLAMCPFCDFAMIPVEGDTVFRCQNSECLKESCLLCKEISHLPLHCDEVEKPADVQRRIYIENKMSEALIRNCVNCGLKYIKSEGCNRMKCPNCSAMMCYLCGSPVEDYKHFNGPGGDKYHLCPLFSDTDELHEENVNKGAELAKQHLLLNKHISHMDTKDESNVELTLMVQQQPPPLPVKQKHRKLTSRRPPPPPPPSARISSIPHTNEHIPSNQQCNMNIQNTKDRKQSILGHNKNNFLQLLEGLIKDRSKRKTVQDQPRKHPPPVPPRTYKNRST